MFVLEFEGLFLKVTLTGGLFLGEMYKICNNFVFRYVFHNFLKILFSSMTKIYIHFVHKIKLKSIKLGDNYTASIEQIFTFSQREL